MIILPAILEGIRSLKDKTYKLTFETNELTPEQFGAIGASLQTFGYLAFKKDPYKEKEREMLNSLESDYEEKGKSKAQRLRAVLYRNWEQESMGYGVFDDYYNHHMERVINHYKEKLD
jgi:hypothetical protein